MRFRSIPVIACLAASLTIVLAATGCGRSPSPNGPPRMLPARSVVTGTVSDTAGAIIAGATVTLRDMHVAPAPARGRTASPTALQHDVLTSASDAAGRYAFEPLPDGDYLMTCDAGGHLTQVVPITIVTGGEINSVDTTRVNIVMTPF